MSKLRVYLDIMYTRTTQAFIQESKKSILLLGPRQTGKSTLIKGLKPDLALNLALERVFLEYSSKPDLLEKTLTQQNPKTVFIDEVQRIPSLLNTIQAILDDHPNRHRFYLTGSSARKLRRGNANLLPGRIVSYHLGPLLAHELGKDLNLETALIYGTLPGVITEEKERERRDILRTYGATYLKEEIQAEALTKQIEGFARFLLVAASKSGEFLDFSKMGTQAAITQKTSSRFFEILEDTLIAYRVDAFATQDARRLIRHPKFYFFDTGVLNGLLKNFILSDDRKDYLFEHFIVNQIITANLAFGESARLSTYRTEAGVEVDLILERDGDILAVEIKSGSRLSSRDFSGLKNFSGFHKKAKLVLLYNGSTAYREDEVAVLHWRQALEEIVQFLK